MLFDLLLFILLSPTTKPMIITTIMIMPMIIIMDPLLIVEVEGFEEEGLDERDGEDKGGDGCGTVIDPKA